MVKRAQFSARAQAAALAVATSLAPAAAVADQTAVVDRAAIVSLFEDGKRLMAEGSFAQACDKLEEGRRLDPDALGLMLKLGECYERSERRASAWAVYLESVSLATRLRDERRALAAEAASRLEPTLPRLRIVVAAESRADGLEIRRDSVPIGRAMWGTAVALDAGTHVVEARAPGRRPWSVRAEVLRPGEVVELAIPVLPLEPPAPDTAEPARGGPQGATPAGGGGAAAESRGRTQRMIGLGVMGLGAAALGVAAGLGVATLVKVEASSGSCDADDYCDARGIELRSDAQDLQTAGFVLVAAGAAVLGAGGITFATAGARPTGGVASLRVGTTGLGAAVGGTFE